MSKPSDLMVVVLVVAAVIWLNIPKLLLPALALVIIGLAAYRRHRDGREPMAEQRYRWQLIASSVVIAAISIPLVLRLVPPNGVYGFRTTLTRSSADIWYPANAFLGWALLVGSVTSAGILAILPMTAKRWLLVVTFFVPILVAVAASLMYLERLR
jgi:hypothetical protein